MSLLANKKIKFILSIDTEEEWNWDDEYPQDNCSVTNIDYLADFHKHCSDLGVKPTYFVDFAVANNPVSSATLKGILKTGNAEIGAHLHPWCNPPYFGKTNDRESHVVNLPIDQVEQKLNRLTEEIKANIGVTPSSFRTGRWGINGEVMRLLVAKGFSVDSSVFPFYENEYFSCNGAPEQPYWPDLEEPLATTEQNTQLFEVPITAGFNRTNYQFFNSVHRTLSLKPWSGLKAVGLLWHSNLLRKIYLSPELADIGDMKKLVDTALARGHEYIHMFMHSSSLLPNANCFEGQSERPILEGVKEIVAHLQSKYEVEFCTVSECKPGSEK